MLIEQYFNVTCHEYWLVSGSHYMRFLWASEVSLYTRMLVMCVRRGGKTGISLPLEIEPKTQNLLKNMKSVTQFRLIHFILAMTVYLPVRHSHCRRVRITVLVPCSKELAVHLYSIAWPNLGTDFSAVGLYCVTIPSFTSWCDSRRFAACCCLLLSADILGLAYSAARQWLLIAVSHVVLYCVKRSQNESIAMQPQV